MSKEWDKVEELVVHHVDDKELAGEVMKILTNKNTAIWLDDDMLGFVSYTRLINMDRDVIITMQKDDIFSYSQWKILINLVNNRDKEIHINSDPNNPTIVKLVDRLGGHWIGDDIVFPKKG